MIRISEPEHGGKYRLASKGRLGPTYDLAHKLGVSQHGQMPPVLLQRGDGENNRRLARQGGQLGRSEFGEVHGELSSRMQIRCAGSKEGDEPRRGNANTSHPVRRLGLPTLPELTGLGIPDAHNPAIVGTHGPPSIATH